jgi:hypothetical protein
MLQTMCRICRYDGQFVHELGGVSRYRMLAEDIANQVTSRLNAGEAVSDVVQSFEDREDRRRAFEVACKTPLMDGIRKRRRANRVLIGIFVFLTVLYAVGLLDALILRENATQIAVGVLGNAVVVYALTRWRAWVYVGIPLWMAVILFGEIHDFSDAGGLDDPVGVVLIGILFAIGALVVWLAIHVRKSLFPYASFRGIKREVNGAVILPVELDHFSGDAA